MHKVGVSRNEVEKNGRVRGRYHLQRIKRKMGAYRLVLLLVSSSLPLVLSDSHLACPADRACPVSTAPASAQGSGICDDSTASVIR